jgi:hypothetical protein
MATLARNAPLVGPRRHYIANSAFNDDFFSYSVSSSFVNNDVVTTGTLEPVAGATSGNCPMGRILRENGKKLFPGSSVGVNQYLVGVYDSVSFLNGFINPNSPIFVPMNTDKPHYLADGNDLTGADLSNQGPAVYTRGDINADGDANIGGNLNVSGVTEISSDTTLGLLGSAIKFIKSGSGTSSDPSDTGANGISTATLTVQTGCVSGKDFFIFERPSGLDSNTMIANFVVTGTAEVTIYIHGNGTGANNTALTYKYTHIRFA